MKCSEGLENFLNFIRDCSQDYNIAVDAENDANNATQDLLHAFELGTWDEPQIIKMSHTLTKVRSERRQAKDVRSVYELVVNWAAANDEFIKSLTRLLGDVRKAERGTEGRLYHNKTDVMSEITPDAAFTPIPETAFEKPSTSCWGLVPAEHLPPDNATDATKEAVTEKKTDSRAFVVGPHCGHQVAAGRRVAAGYRSQTCNYCKQHFYAKVMTGQASSSVPVEPEEGESTP